MKSPRLTLVGAGPGDPELISVKGVKALADADVVLYDALIHPEILLYIPSKALKIFVGKQKGVCQFPQEEINQLIVKYATSHGHVVRLKGGDPFVFGRGHEEMEYAKQFNIPVEVIPGISSSYSVAELQSIPLTRRGYNESFWVVTGTTKEHRLSSDIYLAAKSSATIVVLMGMHKLPEIMNVFRRENKQQTPVAIIQNGSMENEKMVLGRVENIEKVVEENKIGSPAVIVIGEVVSLHPDFTKSVIEVSRISPNEHE